jgi:hypothetical protein
VGKPFRFAFRVKNGEETANTYDVIFAENEQDARAKFSELQELRLKFWGTHDPRENFWDLRNGWFEILAVDELHPATITERPEGAHLNAISALKCLPRRSLVIRPADRACCESGWVHKVLWDAEGHELHDSLSVRGCRGYMETPPRGAPYYLVESADAKLGIFLCQQHLAENFPRWKKMRVGAVNCPRRPEKERIGASGKCSRERARYSIGRNLTGSSGTP